MSCLLNMRENTWQLPYIDLNEKIREAGMAPNNNKSEYFHIFKVLPYIDAIYIKYGSDGKVDEVHRYAFHEGYAWDYYDERVFQERCISEEWCAYSGDLMNEIYNFYNTKHSEWHLKRYYAKSMRLLDHIYNCLIMNTPKEILYKAGLDELAAHIVELDEINLLASNPSDLYDGLSVKVLRTVNCKAGAKLVADSRRRAFIKELNMKFQDTFENNLNDAQCKFLMYLICNDLKVGEVGRLFRARKSALLNAWTSVSFQLFMETEREKIANAKLVELIRQKDPIYAKYIDTRLKSFENKEIIVLISYLGNINVIKEYDAKIRRANRKRVYEWQERDDKYLIRYPQTVNDFCREAIYMQNCLMAYMDPMVENDTTIMFMRRIDDINQPFITLEIEENTLMQAYHRFNTDCTQEEKEWIEDYCIRHGIVTGKFKFDVDIDELY